MSASRPARRAVVVGAALAAASTVAWLARPEGDDNPRRPAPTTTTLSPSEAFAAAYAEGLVAGSDGILDEVQARCITARLLRSVGRESLLLLDTADPSADVRVDVERAYVACVPPEVLARLAERDGG